METECDKMISLYYKHVKQPHWEKEAPKKNAVQVFGK